MPEVTGEVTVSETKKIKCPHCGKEFEQEVEVTGEASIEFEMSDYAPDYDEP